jgi:hypothetical protein
VLYLGCIQACCTPLHLLSASVVCCDWLLGPGMRRTPNSRSLAFLERSNSDVDHVLDYAEILKVTRFDASKSYQCTVLVLGLVRNAFVMRSTFLNSLALYTEPIPDAICNNDEDSKKLIISVPPTSSKHLYSWTSSSFGV